MRVSSSFLYSVSLWSLSYKFEEGIGISTPFIYLLSLPSSLVFLIIVRHRHSLPSSLSYTTFSLLHSSLSNHLVCIFIQLSFISSLVLSFLATFSCVALPFTKFPLSVFILFTLDLRHAGREKDSCLIYTHTNIYCLLVGKGGRERKKNAFSDIF